ARARLGPGVAPGGRPRMSDDIAAADLPARQPRPDPNGGAPRAGSPGAMLVIVSGPSGVGKDTVIDALRRRPAAAEYHYVVTCTTRPRRPYEVDGIHYHFMAAEEFVQLRDAGGLLEANEARGHWYGP